MKPIDERNQKCGGLAAARFGSGDDVMAAQDYRDSAGLNRRRLMMSAVADRAVDLWREFESGKRQCILRGKSGDFGRHQCRAVSMVEGEKRS